MDDELLKLINSKASTQFEKLDEAYANISVEWLNRLIVADV